MQRFLVYRGISHESLVFCRCTCTHTSLEASVYTKKIQVTSRDIPRHTTRERCLTILYHAIENIVETQSMRHTRGA